MAVSGADTSPPWFRRGKPLLLYPRRQERGKDEAWIRSFLARAGAAVLTTVKEGRPYPIPILFVYDPSQEALYFHTGPKGRTYRNLQGSTGFTAWGPLGELLGRGEGEGGGASAERALRLPVVPPPGPGAEGGAVAGPSPLPEPQHNVALAVFEMGRIVPAPEAAEFSLEYASVVVFGRGRVVEDPQEGEYGLRLLMEKYAPHLEGGRDYRELSPEEASRTAVFRVDVLAWSGKAREVPPDHPTAYPFPPPHPGPGPGE